MKMNEWPGILNILIKIFRFYNLSVKQQFGPLLLGSCDQILLQIFYIIGYNLKNTRNEKSVSKIAIWPSLKHLTLKSKVIRQFEFSDIFRTSMENAAGGQGLDIQQLFPS